jgi:hypothetical protein
LNGLTIASIFFIGLLRFHLVGFPDRLLGVRGKTELLLVWHVLPLAAAMPAIYDCSISSYDAALYCLLKFARLSSVYANEAPVDASFTPPLFTFTHADNFPSCLRQR